MARNQWRMGIDMPVGLDYCAIESIARKMEIEISPCMLLKLGALEMYMLDYWRRRRNESGKQH